MSEIKTLSEVESEIRSILKDEKCREKGLEKVFTENGWIMLNPDHNTFSLELGSKDGEYILVIIQDLGTWRLYCLMNHESYF